MALATAANDAVMVEADGGTALSAIGKRPLSIHGRRIPALDGLRGIAILGVFFYHYAGGLLNHGESAAYRVIGTALGLGWTGVDLFFVLSGFLITGILYDSQGKENYYRSFYARRALRIFPIYYLFVAVCLLLAPWAGQHWKPAHLFFLVYLGYPAALVWPSLVTSSAIQVTHLWSLSVEEQFYMLWPWIVARVSRRDSLLHVCMGAGAAALGLRLVLYVLGCSSGWLYTLVFCRMDALAVGAAIALLLRGPLAERLQSWSAPGLILASLAFAGICLYRHTVDRNDPMIATVGYSMIAIGYGSLLLFCLRAGSWWARICSIGSLRIFGRYSYGLYLYHFPLSGLLGPLRSHFVNVTHSFVIGGIAYLTMALLVNLLVAAASFHFIESPIMRMKERFN
jgi:peptidoglycan/LPS O-acetylase OafA/YrhL